MIMRRSVGLAVRGLGILVVAIATVFAFTAPAGAQVAATPEEVAYVPPITGEAKYVAATRACSMVRSLCHYEVDDVRLESMQACLDRKSMVAARAAEVFEPGEPLIRHSTCSSKAEPWASIAPNYQRPMIFADVASCMEGDRLSFAACWARRMADPQRSYELLPRRSS